ncbi:MAG: hypothetical protein WCC95_22850, partial [Candidatus Sulfotelmatobacter sp.]
MNMHLRRVLLFIVLVTPLATPAWAGIVEDVRGALADNSFVAANIFLKSYQGKNGVDGEYVEAYSWLARAALSNSDYDQAAAYAKQTEALAVELLKKRPLDAEPHLPIGLGAAIEVESQALAARGEHEKAVAVLQASIKTYGNTS